MKKIFFSNLLIRLFLNLLIKPFFVFAIDLGIQNRVGAEEYGFYFSLFNLTLILNILLDFGITNFNNRNIAQNHQLLNKHFSKISLLRILLGLFYTLIVILTGIISGYSKEQFQMLYFLIFNQFLLQFILYLRSNISGLQLFIIDTVISVLDRSILIVLCGLMLWTDILVKTFAIEYFVYAQTISYFLTFIISLLIVLVKAGKLKLSFNFSFFLVILKQSLPYALLIFLMFFYNRFDGYIIERLLSNGKLEAGIYAQAFRILDALAQFSLLFGTLLLPIFAKMIKEKEALDELVGFSFILIAIPALVIIIPSVFYSDDIMQFLYWEHQVKASSIFSILIFCFLPISTTYIFGTLLTANGNLKVLNITALLGVITNVSLNLLLIPILGGKGAAISSLITQTLTAFIQMLIVVKFFKIKINLPQTLKILTLIIVLLIGSYLSLQLEMRWITKYLLLIGLGFIGSLLLRIFKFRDFKELFSKKNTI